MRVALITCILVVGCGLAGCYTAEPRSCSVRCGAGGTCPAGMSCAADNFCHAQPGEALCDCQARTCADVADSCGTRPDDCGGTIECGGCDLPLECGGAGTPNVCGDPGQCVPQPCASNACGPVIDTCGDPANCGGCSGSDTCTGGECVACIPTCVNGELACGDDGCGGSCGTCPDSRWDCHPAGVCCIRNNEQCQPLVEGCNCCPGLFCISGFCTPAAGCSMAADRGEIDY